MAKRSETIELTEEDIKEAIDKWLHDKYGPPKLDMAFRPGLSAWKIVLQHQPVYDESPIFSAKASRDTD